MLRLCYVHTIYIYMFKCLYINVTTTFAFIDDDHDDDDDDNYDVARCRRACLGRLLLLLSLGENQQQ